jgi:hypothetical protein
MIIMIVATLVNSVHLLTSYISNTYANSVNHATSMVDTCRANGLVVSITDVHALDSFNCLI